jgi:hypothetical protein
MTGRNPTPWQPPPGRKAARRLALAVGLMLAVLAGCKSKGGGSSSSTGGSGGIAKGDPLTQGPGRQIPPQNVPVGDRATGKTKGDPLLSPTGRERSGANYTDDAERWKGPYLPGEKSTPAALAGKPRDDGDGLRIEAPSGSALQPAGGISTGGAAGAVPEPVAAELRRFGWKPNDTTLDRSDKGEAVLRVGVPIPDPGALGVNPGVGKTPPDAAKQVLELVKSDRQ